MDAAEQSRIMDRIAAAVMPRVMRQIGEAYLRGYPVFVRHGEEGVDVEVIPADQFYLSPNPAAPQTKP